MWYNFYLWGPAANQSAGAWICQIFGTALIWQAAVFARTATLGKAKKSPECVNQEATARIISGTDESWANLLFLTA